MILRVNGACFDRKFARFPGLTVVGQSVEDLTEAVTQVFSVNNLAQLGLDNPTSFEAKRHTHTYNTERGSQKFRASTTPTLKFLQNNLEPKLTGTGTLWTISFRGIIRAAGPVMISSPAFRAPETHA